MNSRGPCPEMADGARHALPALPTEDVMSGGARPHYSNDTSICGGC